MNNGSFESINIKKHLKKRICNEHIWVFTGS